MRSLEMLQKKIQSAQGLQSLVRVMKSLAAMNIRQYEESRQALEEYHRTIELGWYVLPIGWKQSPYFHSYPSSNIGFVIFGSDQGLCGQFNEMLAQFAEENVQKTTLTKLNMLILGEHLSLHDAKYGEPSHIDRLLYPLTKERMSSFLQEILEKIEGWISYHEVQEVYLIYHTLTHKILQPFKKKLLPIDEEEINRCKNQKWPSKTIPIFTLDPEILLKGLVSQYLYSSIYFALIHSLASEYESRLRAMSQAEKHIQDFLEDLWTLFHHERQESITEELLDIEVGFETLRKSFFT